MKTETKEVKQPEIPLQAISTGDSEPIPVVTVTEPLAAIEAANELPAIKEVVQVTPELPAFSNTKTFEHSQRVAKMLASSSLVPQAYQGNVQNTMIALEMANRIGASPLQVMQNLYIVHGKPSWSSSFIIAAINACRKFSPVRFDVTGEGATLACVAWAYDLATGDRLDGPRITMEMANAEGWLNKAGSKWKTMPDLMIRYRAAAFFGRLYAPEILMGMQTADEVEDVQGDPVAKIQIQQSIKEAYNG